MRSKSSIRSRFEKKLCDSIDAWQADLDEWLQHYNHERTHQGKICCGRTPLQTMIEGKEIWKEKFVNWTWPDRLLQKYGQLSDHI